MTKSKGTRSSVLRVGRDGAIVTRKGKQGRPEKRRNELTTRFIHPRCPSTITTLASHRVFFSRRFRMKIALQTITAQNYKLSPSPLNSARRPSFLIVTLSLNERKLDTCSREEAKKFFGFLILLIADLLFGTGWYIRDLWKQDRFNETISFFFKRDLAKMNRSVKTNNSKIVIDEDGIDAMRGSLMNFASFRIETHE
jgi:hypothetical protein